MKKRKALPNIIGVLLAVGIVIGGVAIPINLLNDQERRIVGKSHNALIDDYGVVSMPPSARQTDSAHGRPEVTPTPAPTPAPLPTAGNLNSGMSVDELYAHLYAWNMSGSLAYREPRADELSMEQAVAYAKAAIQGIVNAGAFSGDAWSGYRFTGARLLANAVPVAANETTLAIGGITVPASMGRWIVSLESGAGEGNITVDCDALTGTLYEIRITDDADLLRISPDRLLNLLAVYFKLYDDGLSMENQSAGSITCERFELLFHSENANSYTFSINPRINN